MAQVSFPAYKTFYGGLTCLLVETCQNFTHREFSFTLPSDIYIRYNSFQDIDMMKKEIERLQPVKIDIGAVYSVKASNIKTIASIMSNIQ